MKRGSLLLLSLVGIAGIILLIACNTGAPGAGGGSGGRSTGGSGGPGTTGTAVTTTLSDPATCLSPSGPYSHIYVTITDVKLSSNATAADNDSSFVDFTPSLKSAPVQVDLLSTTLNSCFLTTLASGTSVPADTYKQMRVLLLDNAAIKPANNKCGAAANCVVFASDNSIHPLALTGESTTGIKVTADQLGGGFIVGSGGAQNFNVNFDACASVVVQNNGQFHLQPSVNGGGLGATTAITGRLVDSTTNSSIISASATVALEQKDSTGVDRIIMETEPDLSGGFTFCPVPSGTYEVVAAAVNGFGLSYAATVTVGVQPGAVLGNIPMVPQTGINTTQASLTGLVSTAGTNGAIAADVTLSALQTIPTGSTTTATITIPLAQQTSSTVTLSTAAGSASLICPSNTDCANYTLSVPATAPTVSIFGVSAYVSSSAAASYAVQGHAFIPSSGGKDNCSPSIVTSSPATAVTPGKSFTVSNLSFTGCQ